MIKTQRLYLRSFLETDSKDIYEYLSLPEVTKYEPYDPITLEESKIIALQRSKDDRFLAICLLDSHKVIGNIFLTKEAPDYINTYKLGYVLNPEYQSMGFATEAALAILDDVFNEKNAHRLIAYCNVKNEKSWKLLERLNMRREATHIENIYFKTNSKGEPIWNSSHIYAILRSEYLKNRGL